MKFARELAKGFFDLIRAGGARHAEALVIIFILNGHKLNAEECACWQAFVKNKKREDNFALRKA
jgi:hypothetical protein